MKFETLWKWYPDLRPEIEQLSAMESRRNAFYQPFESAQEAARPEPPTLAPGMTITRWAPPRSANFTSDVAVPVLQSIVAATFSIVVVFVILETVTLFGDLRQEALTIASVIGAIVLFVVYIILMRRHSDATTLVQIIEEVTRLDIDRDGAIGNPEPQPTQPQEVTRPILVNREPPVAMYDIPGFGKVPREAMYTFLDYADEDGLTLDAARSAGLSRKEWEAVIAYLVKLQLAESKVQGEDAHMLVGHDVLMRGIFSGT